MYLRTTQKHILPYKPIMVMGGCTKLLLFAYEPPKSTFFLLRVFWQYIGMIVCDSFVWGSEANSGFGFRGGRPGLFGVTEFRILL